VNPVPPPPFPRRPRSWPRFLAAALLVVVLTAGTTATAGLLEVQTFVDDLRQGGTIHGVAGVISRADVGDPQTILLIGSDRRYGEDRTNARSDTMMLVRLDPDAAATTVLSIPRDLKVDYEHPRGTLNESRKINETYTVGGEALTARVIKRLLQIEINHIVNVNFKGFRAVVDAIDCVYVDVDRRYYHVNQPGYEQYAEINVSAGYQKLCGEKSLDYVRFRHADSDFVRAARQQDFLRQAKSQYGVDRFLDNPHEISQEVGRFLRTDASLQSKEELLTLANLLAYSARNPIRQIRFPAGAELSGGVSFVVAGEQTLREVRRQFLSPPPRDPGAGRGASAKKRARGTRRGPSLAGLADMSQTGQDHAIQLGAMRFPVYYPRLLVAGDQYMPVEHNIDGRLEYPRKYRIKDPDGRMRGAYRFVVATGQDGNYYGIQGTSWTDPPILRNPSSERRTVNGKRLLLFYDGRRLRTVGWRTSRGAYWVQNTLEAELTNDQMLAIAGSLTRLGR
jgi:polyisoprenyl-teichoic acid--peptidoglycan teichoic acid transferase